MASVFSPVRQMLADEYRRVTDVTYLGTVYGTLAALKRMFARDRGMIVQVGSALAYRSIPLQSAYCAAKHAIVGFTDSLRSELIHDGSHVKLTVVHLPAVNTPQFGWARSRLPNEPQPVPPIFQPEVAARAIVWATEHHRREGWVGWPTMKAIVGQRLIPGLLDRYLAHVGYSAQQTDQPESPARVTISMRRSRATTVLTGRSTDARVRAVSSGWPRAAGCGSALPRSWWPRWRVSPLCRRRALERIADGGCQAERR